MAYIAGPAMFQPNDPVDVMRVKQLPPIEGSDEVQVEHYWDRVTYVNNTQKGNPIIRFSDGSLLELNGYSSLRKAKGS